MSFSTEVDLGKLFKARKRFEFIRIKIDGDLTANELLIILERTLELAQDAIAFRTGAARASLQIQIDPDGKSGSIGSDGGVGPDGVRRKYLKHLELGTTKMSARPFLFPSAVRALNEFKERYPLKVKELARISV